MTSRLKHKLELENINLKSGYLNESFVQVSLPNYANDVQQADTVRSVPRFPLLQMERRTSSNMFPSGSRR